ncbi:MAG: outer membrane protein assembly factor BamA [Candidatus Dependentiae bacterium]|nr:outer membrane protein assembly factor BamA [Candidatus Dependentiae bacterium]
MIEARKYILLSLSFLLCSNTSGVGIEKTDYDNHDDLEDNHLHLDIDENLPAVRTIHDIIISGNKYTSREAILSYIPYKVGEIFNPRKTNTLIHNLYFGLKRFTNITVKGESVGANLINVHVIVEEKPVLKDIIIEGNISIGDKEIRKKIDFNLPAIQDSELKIMGQKIKRLYLDKGFVQAEVDTELRIDDDGRAIALFTIHEHKKSLVKRILFTGNNNISSKILRTIVLTREDWLLSFLDKSGTFHPERLGADQHVIEQHYQNNGFLAAKVTEVEKTIDQETKCMALTFHIEEGALYHIKKIEVPGNDILTQEQLLTTIPIKVDGIYSRKDIADSIKILEFVWGNYGYIFAHIEPSIDTDEDEKTVSITLSSELGNKVSLNKINIKGNKKTRDKIIRRKLLLEEGGLITNRLMEISKNSVESLGFFDPREGVNWKINRLSEDVADLDLLLKEAKTGNFVAQMGFGGSGTNMSSPNSGFNVKTGFADRNLFGSGININFDASWARSEQTVLFHIDQPWLFDKPVSGAFDLYHRRPSYDMLKHINPNVVNEKLTGASVGTGFITQGHHFLLRNTHTRANLGIDRVLYERRPVASGLSAENTALYQHILDKEFVSGKFLWLACYLEQDFRNHPVHTSRGHRWALTSKVAIPTFGDTIGFYKLTLDGSWYTPIIGEQDLVFRCRGFMGWAIPLKNKVIPYGELFHIGGPASVRGFLYGQVGPKFEGDSIGGQKAFFVNAELVFPITADLNMKGALFYDGGVGFDNPYVNQDNCKPITNNKFDYRHAVGFGIRILSPMPVKIDWGFKIDPRTYESSHEVHFGMTYDW